ncbi:MAG: response regulator [Clostridia bacterium]|nr:response regulator [Clostridia bacterium]
MYKVFVVDDEIVIREGLRNNIDWEANGFQLVGEAPDGEIALPMIRDEKPDILITDIRMPFLDGIALCREVRRVMPWIQIVILSGFDSFDYAKQAISLGVQEYLLKPISSDELKSVLFRLVKSIEKEQMEQQDLEKLRQQMRNGKKLVQEQIISNVIMNGVSETEGKKICTQMRSFGINLISSRYTVIEFRASSEDADYTDMHANLMKLMERCYDSVFLSSGEGFLNALVLGDSEKDIEERAYSFARSALDELDRAGCGDVRASIGETVADFCDISSSYKSARHTRHVAENNRQPLQMRRIIGARDVRETPRSADKALEVQSLYDRMKYADLGDFKEQLMDYVDSLKTMNACIPLDGNYLRSEVLMTAFRIIQEAGGDPQKVLEPVWLDRSTAGLDDLEGYISRALAVMHRAIKFRESNGSVKGNPAVNKARRYLESNFTNPNLTFQDVVDYVAMSSSHFSTLFSQTTGMTFTKYLIDLRMAKARELLYSTSMRSSEIAYAVGYNDPHYFSYLFKKCSGVTPSEFRSGFAKAGEEPQED